MCCWITLPSVVCSLVGRLQSMEKQSCCAAFSFLCPPRFEKQAFVASGHKKKANRKVGFSMLWRRERDSNPRRFHPQRFSRPPHSTALPSLQIELRSGCVWECKSNLFFGFSKSLLNFHFLTHHLPNHHLL